MAIPLMSADCVLNFDARFDGTVKEQTESCLPPQSQAQVTGNTHGSRVFIAKKLCVTRNGSRMMKDSRDNY